MGKREISNRTDVALLVETFYNNVRKDELLGPIFNSIISNWDEHLETLINFWTTNLFFEKTYTGNPIQRHIEVDKACHGKINELHFGIWINLWFQTIDELFVGETAQIAKNRARNMATHLHINMFQARSVGNS